MRTYFVVRAAFDDPSGGMTHDAIFGTDPTVFTDERAAIQRRDELSRSAKDLDWGGDAPIYFVEELTGEDLDLAEMRQLGTAIG